MPVGIENYPMEIVGEDHFTVTIYYTIIFEIHQKYKNWSDHQ